MTLTPRNALSKIISLILVMSFVYACSPPRGEAGTHGVPQGDVALAAAAQSVAGDFLAEWQAEDYGAMYEYLSTLSQDAITLEEFEKTHREVANTLTLQTLQYRLLSSMAAGESAQAAYQVVFDTLLAGELSRETIMNLVWEDGGWRIQWEIGMILPDLRDDRSLEFVHKIPDRGRIFARNGAPLAAYQDAIALGVVPGEILPEQAETLFATLAEISTYTPEALADLVERTPDHWYVPVTTRSPEALAPYLPILNELSGVRIDTFRSRFYLDGGVAPHVLGYMLYIPAEEVDQYIRLGYRQDERIGAAGLEAVYESALSGQRGGSLYLTGPDGGIQSLLAASDPQPGQSIYTTLDKTLQMRLQESLGDLRGAVVVMEVATGRVLALVSSPGYDPNVFDLNENDRSILDSYFTNEDQPLFNRATQGQYPLGSVFKIISMAAALEAEVYTEFSIFNCGHTYWTCNSVTLEDWTLGHGLPAGGLLTLPEGLMRSCNPWFYRIGETLYNAGLDASLVEMARSFGLGQPTGIDIPEAFGNIPETAVSCVNNAQLAIGQGEILVTPLQVASFISAVANGGTLYRPALVERIQSGSATPNFEFSPEIIGELSVSPETLSILQEAMRLVVEDPYGTGTYAMAGLEVPVSGKTGTAQTPTGNAHAWFAGYTRQNDPDRPDIAVVVLIENGGEGSQMAAPVFRRAVSLYFSNYEDPAGVMPWESEPYILKEPSPTVTPTEESPSEE